MSRCRISADELDAAVAGLLAYRGSRSKRTSRCALCRREAPSGHAHRLYVSQCYRGMLCLDCGSGVPTYREHLALVPRQ